MQSKGIDSRQRVSIILAASGLQSSGNHLSSFDQKPRRVRQEVCANYIGPTESGEVMLKKIIIGSVGIIAVLAVVGLLLPRQSHIERSITIDRPASRVFGVINSFKLFPRWSPWQHLDPNMKQTVEGPAEGVGATLKWSGNDKVGTGTQVITASTPNESVASDLSFGNMGTSKSVMHLSSDGKSTTVRWTLESDMGAGPVGRYFGLMMDSMVGKDFDAGLKNLKALLENMPATDAPMP
jgi:uncharacterized membrane protein